MEIKEVEKELQSYIRNKRYIERKQEDLEVLTERINKITASYSDMPKGGASSREDLIAKKIDLENEMYSYLLELVEQKAIIERTIRALEQPYRNILDFRYIEDMQLVEVAAKENYSYRQCKRLLKDAYVKYAEKREEFRNESI